MTVDPVIRKIHFASNAYTDGLPNEITLANLGRVVIFAGPNGSGKTRLLARIADALAPEPTPSKSTDRLAQGTATIDFSNWVRRNSLQMVQLGSTIEWFKATQFTLYEILAFTEAFERDPSAFYEIQQNALGIIQGITHQHMVVSHPDMQRAGERIGPQQIENWFARLKDTAERLLNTKLEIDSQGMPRLFGRSLDDLRESAGQRKLLQYCLALSSIATDSQGIPVVFVIDEPEVHLHPAALVGLMDRLVQSFSTAQLFIATHSLPLIAHFGFENVWIAQDGRFSPARAAPEAAILSLLGGPADIDKLRSALDEPPKRALATFAAESLLAPATVPHRLNDPQCEQVLELLRANCEKRATGERRIRLLDFGAGRGRLASAIFETTHSENLSVDYYAYDPSSENREECLSAIHLIHPSDATSRYFNSEADLIKVLGEGYIDVMVLCNVLHEIHPVKWREQVWERTSRTLLDRQGVLLVLEDLKISHGEKAYDEGFLILDERGIQYLFNCERGKGFEFSFFDDERYRNRLVMYVLGKTTLSNLTNRTIKKTIEYTIDQAKQRISELRTKAVTLESSRDHARYVMQLANAILLKDQFV